MQKRKVIVVGGGLAGLSAAYELTKVEGLDIHLLEKNERLGGRVHTCTINGQVIDIGGFLIYPWYKRYHELIKELNLAEELIKTPPATDYYACKHHQHDEYQKGFALSFKDMVEVFIKFFPAPLTDSDPTNPELHDYNDLSIKDYLKGLDIWHEKLNLYLNIFDTYLQGYCYGPVAEHKMSFMAATIFQNMVHGDVHSASYLCNGSKVFIDAMKEELEKRGVKIHLHCTLETTEKKQVITNLGVMTADDFVFCHTPAEVKYSKFITATVSYSGTALINGDADWGSCFYKEEPEQLFPILSVVNLEKLYTTKAAQHLNLNIKVNEPKQASINSADLFEIICAELQVHFRDIKVLELVNRIDWEKAMPIATESFVEKIKHMQGHDNFYFAGDFMGCPSMETALMSGKRAAEQLIKNLKI